MTCSVKVGRRRSEEFRRHVWKRENLQDSSGTILGSVSLQTLVNHLVEQVVFESVENFIFHLTVFVEISFVENAD